MIAHHEAWELLPDVAAGVMDSDEREALEEHLDECPICRAELDTLRSAVELLSGAPALLDPPSSLRAKVLAIPEAAERELEPEGVSVLRQPARRRRSFSGAGAWAAAAVAMVLVAAVAFGAVFALRSDNGFKAAEKIHLRDGKGNWAVAEIGKPNGDQDVALQIKAHLPANGHGWYYQVWLGKPNQRLSIGDFTISPGQDTTARMNLPREAMREYKWIWVTREQDDGDAAPGATVLAGKL